MSPTKNTRPTRRPRRSPTVPARTATQIDTPAKRQPTWRHYLLQMGVAHGVVVLLIVLLSVAGLLVLGRPLQALPATIASAWLVLHLAPVSLHGITLGLLPGLPAAAMVWHVSRRIHILVRERISLVGLGAIAAASVGFPLALTGIAMGMIWDASVVFPVGFGPWWQVLLAPLLLHATALVLGMRPRLWKALARKVNLPESLIDAARTAGILLLGLSAAGLVVWLLGLAAHWRDQMAIASHYTGAGYAAVFVLGLLYLPNLAVAGASYLLGGDIRVGEVSLSVLAAHPVDLPPVPLLAAAPQSAPVWLLAILVLAPAVTGAVMYRWGSRDWLHVVITGGLVGCAVLVAAWLAGGMLGNLGFVGPTAWLAGLLAAVWTLGMGMALVVVQKVVHR